MNGFLLACLATAATGALMIVWSRAMRRVEMGQRLWQLNLMAWVAVVVGIAAFTRGVGVGGGVLAGISIVGGAAFLGLGFFLSALSKQAPAVTVGAPLPMFTAPDEDGDPFDIATLRGTPFLLKFFRGHW